MRVYGSRLAGSNRGGHPSRLSALATSTRARWLSVTHRAALPCCRAWSAAAKSAWACWSSARALARSPLRRLLVPAARRVLVGWWRGAGHVADRVDESVADADLRAVLHHHVAQGEVRRGVGLQTAARTPVRRTSGRTSSGTDVTLPYCVVASPSLNFCVSRVICGSEIRLL